MKTRRMLAPPLAWVLLDIRLMSSLLARLANRGLLDARDVQKIIEDTRAGLALDVPTAGEPVIAAARSLLDQLFQPGGGSPRMDA